MSKKRTLSTHTRPAPALNDDLNFLPGEETVFDRTAQQAIELFSVPIALIVLRDSAGDRVSARAGRMSPVETRQGPQLCARIMDDNRAVAIADTTREAASTPYRWMLEGHRIQFFAGYPIRNNSGDALGALVLMDRRTRHFGEGDLNALGEVARSLEAHIDHLAPETWGRRAPAAGDARPALRLVRGEVDDLVQEPIDDDVCILVVDIDTPVEIEVALGSNIVDRISRRIRDQINHITRAGDVVDRTPQGELMLFIRGNEQAARRVAGRVGALLDGARLGLP